MKLLIDQQLPLALKAFFLEKGVEAAHVHELGMANAPDCEIWLYAATYGFDLISKDEDFFYMVACNETGPRLIWVRLGNRSTGALVAALTEVWPGLRQWIASGERIVEIR